MKCPNPILSVLMFTEVNPDKGTETFIPVYPLSIIFEEFTEVNPDKGTETKYQIMVIVHHIMIVYRS